MLQPHRFRSCVAVFLAVNLTFRTVDPTQTTWGAVSFDNAPPGTARSCCEPLGSNGWKPLSLSSSFYFDLSVVPFHAKLVAESGPISGTWFSGACPSGLLIWGAPLSSGVPQYVPGRKKHLGADAGGSDSFSPALGRKRPALILLPSALQSLLFCEKQFAHLQDCIHKTFIEYRNHFLMTHEAMEHIVRARHPKRNQDD